MSYQSRLKEDFQWLDSRMMAEDLRYRSQDLPIFILGAQLDHIAIDAFFPVEIGASRFHIEAPFADRFQELCADCHAAAATCTETHLFQRDNSHLREARHGEPECIKHVCKIIFWDSVSACSHPSGRACHRYLLLPGVGTG